MLCQDQILSSSIAVEGVEVTTAKIGDEFVTTIHGGPLDGDEFTCASNPRVQHDRACSMARIAERDIVCEPC